MKFRKHAAKSSGQGVGVGLLVLHLHREEKDATPIWIGLGPAGDEGNGLSLSGAF